MAVGSTTSAALAVPPRHTAWENWVLPSVGDLIFVALLVLLGFTNLSVRLLGDAGIGWHIRTGQMILATHSVPHTDPFSSTMAGQPWFAWEWLYDVIVGSLDRFAGLNGVVLFAAFTIAFVFSWTFRLLIRRETNVLVALVLVLLALSASMIHFLARPHLLSWLFALLWFQILESSKGKRAWTLWLLPPSMVLWVNLHGGFLLGFVLLGIYWLAAAWRWFTLREQSFDDVLQKLQAGRRAWLLARIGTLSALATLANPYGFQLHIHIYRYLSNRFLMDHIDEFQSPNFHGVAQKCFAILLLLTLAAWAARRRALSLNEALVVLFAVYSGLYASRNIPVSSVLIVLAIGPPLSDALRRFSERLHRRPAGPTPRTPSQPFLQRMQAIESKQRGCLWPVAATLLACWVAAHGGRLRANTLMDAHFDGKRFPVNAVSYLERNNIPGPLLSTDTWGGYLIYRLYPRTQVVVDDRHDLYGEAFLVSYLKLMHVEPGWDDFLRQHPARSIVVRNDSALANILDETTGWQQVYRDEVAVVFVASATNGD